VVSVEQTATPYIISIGKSEGKISFFEVVRVNARIILKCILNKCVCVYELYYLPNKCLLNSVMTIWITCKREILK
jgi:hypothetical protein